MLRFLIRFSQITATIAKLLITYRGNFLKALVITAMVPGVLAIEGILQPLSGNAPDAQIRNTIHQEHHSGLLQGGPSPRHNTFLVYNRDERSPAFGSRETTSGTREDTLYVKEFVLARDVVEREPVDIVDSYAMSDARAWAFARIHNSENMQEVTFHWYYEGELYYEMISKIGLSSHWRTYSSVGLQPGSWRVTLTNEDDVILEELTFRVSG